MKGAHRRRRRRRPIAKRLAWGVAGAVLAGGSAFAATNWAIGLSSGSSGESQAASVGNLTVTALASPAAGNLLYPGSTGDVVLSITNPNAFPVTITGVDLPSNTTYATGYTSSALTGSISGCSSSNSDVTWAYSTSSSGSVHSLTTPLVVASNGSLTVTLTNDASMATAAPAACESAYFSMPAMTGIVATGGSGTATSSPATDAWTS